MLRLEARSGLGQRLDLALAACPLPAGWRLAKIGEEASFTARLEALPDGITSNADANTSSPSFPAGLRYRAIHVDMGDPRFSIGRVEAMALPSLALEDITAPSRVLRVEGLWPGEKGYPLVELLVLSLESRSVASGLASLFPSSRKRASPRELRAWAEKAAAFLAAAEEKPIVLGAAGDIQVGPEETPLLLGGDPGLGALLGGGLLERIRAADIAVANLEGPISARGEANPRKRYLFRMSPGTATALRQAGFDLLSFANNHTLDYGELAFSDSLAELAEAGMPVVGAGENLAQASRAIVLPHPALAKGGRFAFVGFASYPKERMGYTTEEGAAERDKPGFSADEAATLASIRASVREGDTVIVLAHGGAEYRFEPTLEIRKRYALFADAGAALVLGSHPHLLQGAAARGDSVIAYSLGNFLFTGEREPPDAQRSAFLEFLFYRGLVRGLAPYPVRVGFGASAADARARETEEAFARRSAALALLDEGVLEAQRTDADQHEPALVSR